MGERESEDWARLAQNLRVERALLDVLDLLPDVEVVVFKGGLLTRRLYGDLRARASVDNDLLVRKTDGGRVLERLLSLGYLPADGLDPKRALARAGQVALWPPVPGGISLDLHVDPFSSSFFEVPEAVVWSHVEEAELHGRKVLTFDAPLSLVHMVAHYFQHLLEPELLPHIAQAWNVFGHAVDRDALACLGEATGTDAAMAFTLGTLQRRGSLVAAPPTHPRAEWVLDILGGDWVDWPLGASARGLISVLVAEPRKLGMALRRGFFPDRDELTYRYGTRSYLVGLAKHFLRRLTSTI